MTAFHRPLLESLQTVSVRCFASVEPYATPTARVAPPQIAAPITKTGRLAQYVKKFRPKEIVGTCTEALSAFFRSPWSEWNTNCTRIFPEKPGSSEIRSENFILSAMAADSLGFLKIRRRLSEVVMAMCRRLSEPRVSSFVPGSSSCQTEDKRGYPLRGNLTASGRVDRCLRTPSDYRTEFLWPTNQLHRTN